MNAQSLVPVILPVHVLAGMVALGAGYVALSARKGAAVHRTSGMLFVAAMITMSVSGASMDALSHRTLSINVVAGLVTFYFVTTGLLAARRRDGSPHRVDMMLMGLALAVAVLAGRAAVGLMQSGKPEAGPAFVFAFVTLLAAIGDMRMVRGRGLPGGRRIARHLWRMCFGMWIAAASFFWGPPRRVPEAIRIPALLAVAVLLPVAAMVYWLWRGRSRRAVSQ